MNDFARCFITIFVAIVSIFFLNACSGQSSFASIPTGQCDHTVETLKADFYVSPNGSDNNPGTEAKPFASAARAQLAASPGDLIYFRGGKYEFNSTSEDIGVLFSKSGLPGKPIRYWAYPGETPVFDFNKLLTQARVRGFAVRANWLHFRGLELTGVQQILTNVNESWAIRVENDASHNVFEHLNLHHNEGPGLFIADGGHNLVLNVDSHHNYDPDRGGENADGFGCHSNDPGNVFRGNRAWFNSDDGYDFINSPGACVVEYSMAFFNGFVPDTQIRAGNGSGFKAGGFGLNPENKPDTVPRHVVRFNIAAHNGAVGFYANHHPGGVDWLHNTAYDNPRNFDMLADMGPADHMMQNNVALAPGKLLVNASAQNVNDLGNAWSLGVNVLAKDFESLNVNDALKPRNPDGSLPTPLFLYPAQKSALIGAGTKNAAADTDKPDLGAYQTKARKRCEAHSPKLIQER